MAMRRDRTIAAAGGGQSVLDGGAGVARDNTPSLGAYVYDAIRAAIRNGDYRPGERLREEDIARHLNVSRTPVREALAKLQSKGLLANGEGRGLTVKRFGLSDVMELYAMSEIVEGAAASLAAEHASASDLEALRDLDEAFHASFEDTGELARLNLRLHATIHRAARNRYLDVAIGEVQDTIEILDTAPYALPERAQEAAAEHRAIVDAIAGRDAAAAERASRAHVRASLRLRLRLLRIG